MFQNDDDNDSEFEFEVTSELVHDLAAIGVHITYCQTFVDPHHGPLMALSATLGPSAFSRQVLDPRQSRIDDEFDDLTRTVIEDDYERRRRDLLDGQ